MTFKAGDIVTVYEDPVSAKKEEGKAKLLRKVCMAGFYGGFRLELWQVQFEGEKEKVFRKIRVEEA